MYRTRNEVKYWRASQSFLIGLPISTRRKREGFPTSSISNDRTFLARTASREIRSAALYTAWSTRVFSFLLSMRSLLQPYVFVSKFQSRLRRASVRRVAGSAHAMLLQRISQGKVERNGVSLSFEII